jgi:hypothetical protein
MFLRAAVSVWPVNKIGKIAAICAIFGLRRPADAFFRARRN